MPYRLGSGFIGSPDLQTSVANQEVIPVGKTCYKFSFMNQSTCHIVVNGGTAMYLGSGQGFDASIEDAWINSFKVVESGIVFNFIACYR